MLVYKSHYPCDYIHPQIVMNALRWLKVNNPHYQDIETDEKWPEKSNDDRVCKNISNNGDSEKSEGEDCDEDCESDDENESLTQDEIDEDSNSEDEDEKTDEEMEEAKLKEDQVELDRKATVTVEGSSTCLQIDDLEEAVFSLAPGQNSVPKFILMDHDFENLAFPNYFPGGYGGYDVLESRKTKLDLRRYVNQRLLNVKAHFSQDLDFIVAFQYAMELQQLKSEMNIALKKTNGSTHAAWINAGNFKNFDFVNNLVKQDYAYKFMNNV